MPDIDGFFHAFQAGGPFSPSFMAVVGALRTSRHNQPVVFEVGAISE